MAPLPPLNALKAFEISSRTSSFTRAADELCISQGAVSRHIAHLEDFLGIKLFRRGHRQVELTREGLEYSRELREVFDRLRKATDAVMKKTQRHTVRIMLFPTVATQWLMPRLSRFHARHPNIDLIVKTSAASVDPGRFDYDVVNRRAPLADPEIEYIPLFDIVLQPVCSPRILEGVSLRNPVDLSRVMLLHSINRVGDWQAWFQHVGVTDVELGRGLEFDNTALACQAAASGTGVAMGIVAALRDDLAERNLVAPFPDALNTGESYGLAIERRKLADPAIAAFRNWIVEETSREKLAVSTPDVCAGAAHGGIHLHS
ncbi:LysR substrate-binding domain-containing protein [Rhizobium rhizogenes]|uniref:LysR substrate-binding domain-containing protein n=1 Tax=Rhizobium rhizogenes TaxID=359 RepID=UPI0015744407|nr:LysR substrate-binding domain-containing protein [Rhizobium rhizogenes]NTI78534.1 LysR family transcriptional regulator [Rhizobium rhizogenes]